MKIFDKIINTLFNRNKLYLLAIFIFGFILRLISARNLGVSADDVNHAIRQAGIFNSGKLVIWDQSTALWYYLEGIFYKSSSIVASRFASVIFGSFLIILMYLFVKKVFKSEKAAFISSFLVALSPILIKETLPEMDIALCFFLILAAYFLFSYIESKKRNDLLWMSIILGLGIMIKLYMAFFAISFIILLIFLENKSGKKPKEILKTVFIIGIILFVLCLPTFAHNYLLYKDKGFTDLIFTNVFHLGEDKAKEIYGWSAGWMPYSDYVGFLLGNQKNFDPTPIPGFILVLGMLFRGDPIILILGFLGLIFVFKKHKNYFWFFLITFIPAFIYLGAQIPMAKHFIWALVLIAPCAGLMIEKVSEKFKLKYLIIIILIFNLLYLGMPKDVTHASFYGQSSFGQLVSYKSNIPNDALVITDSRIYSGNVHFGLDGTNYLDASQFLQAVQKLNTNIKNQDVYFIECAIDDCGWGTIYNQPELNKSMEYLVQTFSNISYSRVDFIAPNPEKYYLPFMQEKRVDYRVYKAEVAINPAIVQAAKQTHIWWFYPEDYDRNLSEIFDDYYTYNSLDDLINKSAFFILYLEIFLSYLAIIYTLYLFIED